MEGRKTSFNGFYYRFNYRKTVEKQERDPQIIIMQVAVGLLTWVVPGYGFLNKKSQTRRSTSHVGIHMHTNVCKPPLFCPAAAALAREKLQNIHFLKYCMDIRGNYATRSQFYVSLPHPPVTVLNHSTGSERSFFSLLTYALKNAHKKYWSVHASDFVVHAYVYKLWQKLIFLILALIKLNIKDMDIKNMSQFMWVANTCVRMYTSSDKGSFFFAYLTLIYMIPRGWHAFIHTCILCNSTSWGNHP